MQAPAGYAPEDYDYHSFRVIKGVPQYQFVIANKPGTPPPYEPGGPTYQIELKKVDKETRESLAGAEFELWSAKLADDGITLVPDAKLVTKNLVTGQYGIARVTVSHKGKFFYREVKAPTGYEADTDFHLIDTSTTVDLITRVEVENEKLPEEKEEPKKPYRPTKPDQPPQPDKPKKAKEVPKTGDPLPLRRMLVLLFASGLGLLVATRKSNNKEEKKSQLRW